MNRPSLEVADILRALRKRFLRRFKSSRSYQQLKVFRAIERCRTAALGGHEDKCVGCAYEAPFSYNSCRSRCCPKCQARARQRWIEARHAAADAQNFQVSPDYFRAAGTVMLAGRTFTMHDEEKAPNVAVVNREFARKLFGSVDKAVGQHFKFWGGQRAEVIGVVEDGKYQTLTEDQKPAMFFSFLQHQRSDVWILVRSERDPQEIGADLQRSMRSLDPTMPLEIKTWNSEMDSALFAASVATAALGALGLLGALLAITGIFGIASYTVSKRLRELGLRIALGANQGKVLSAALGRAFRLLAVGSAAGMILGVLATRVLSSIVYQATPRDPLILGGVVLTMLWVGILAATIPARRALAADPMTLLREE